MVGLGINYFEHVLSPHKNEISQRGRASFLEPPQQILGQKKGRKTDFFRITKFFTEIVLVFENQKKTSRSFKKFIKNISRSGVWE